MEIELTEEQVDWILDGLRADGFADSRFDINLAEGKHNENKLLKTLQLDTIEVKTDYGATNTGNVFVEYMYKDKPSGISVTEASHYAIVIPDKSNSKNVTIIIETKVLKEIIRDKEDRMGGDDNQSKGKLIKVEELVNWI